MSLIKIEPIILSCVKGFWCEFWGTGQSTINCQSLLLVSRWLVKIRIYNLMTASRKKKPNEIRPITLLLRVFYLKWNSQTAGYFFELCSKQQSHLDVECYLSFISGSNDQALDQVTLSICWCLLTFNPQAESMKMKKLIGLTACYPQQNGGENCMNYQYILALYF